MTNYYAGELTNISVSFLFSETFHFSKPYCIWIIWMIKLNGDRFVFQCFCAKFDINSEGIIYQIKIVDHITLLAKWLVSVWSLNQITCRPIFILRYFSTVSISVLKKQNRVNMNDFFHVPFFGFFIGFNGAN